MINSLVRRAILDMKPYHSARLIGGTGDVWLNANEYPDSVPYSLNTITEESLNRYPDCQPTSVLERYAAYAHLPAENILITRGADEGIEILMRTFCEPGIDQVLFCPPTYGMYLVSAASLGTQCQQIPTRVDWQLDLDAIEKHLAGVKIVYICNPNNPTGNLLAADDLQQLLHLTHQRAIVVVDEAYIDFCPQASVISWITNYPHLVVLRTLSKAFALAGLRCGFTLANRDIIQLLLKVIAPYPIATPVADIAAQALHPNAISQMQQRVAKLNQLRDEFSEALRDCAVVQQVFPSTANYLLVKFYHASDVFSQLSAQGIVLRDQQQHPSLAGCLRISIGTHMECQRVLAALHQLATRGEYGQ